MVKKTMQYVLLACLAVAATKSLANFVLIADVSTRLFHLAIALASILALGLIVRKKDGQFRFVVSTCLAVVTSFFLLEGVWILRSTLGGDFVRLQTGDVLANTTYGLFTIILFFAALYYVSRTIKEKKT